MKQNAQRIRNKFVASGVEVVLAADETFIRFHEEDSSIICPVGAKRVGRASKKDLKDGATLMVTMDMASSQLTQPFIIFKGVFGATLMNKFGSI